MIRLDKIILVSGQSNALGYGGQYDPYLKDDSIDNRIFGYCETKNKWIVFDLALKIGAKPAGFQCMGFHFAKRYLKDCPNHKVGIIISGQAGTPISFWINSIGNMLTSRYNNIDIGIIFNKLIVNVNDALRLSSESKVDIILWHQGESDEAKSNMYYYERLHALICQFRKHICFGKKVIFIAGELRHGKQNVALNMLNQDNDIYTICACNRFLESDDHVHFSSKGHRNLGLQYYYAYSKIKRHFSIFEKFRY